MTAWLDPQPVDVPESLQAAVDDHPLVAQILAQRGMTDPQAARAFLDPHLYRPASPFDLPDMDRAVERIRRAIARKERIAIWGDFDVDGQTATTVLASALAALGADVIFHIPVRAEEGHGVNLPWLQRLIDDGAGLVITCDTGITAHDAVGYARSRGVDVIVSDHHELADTLPTAVAAVNPKRLPEEHALAALPGVGVAYKLAEALAARFGRPEIAAQQLDLIALGIVADVALLVGDTRFLLQCGLEALRTTQRLGLQVMLELADVNPGWLTEEHVGFELGPRLNALGRLGDANLAVEFLTTNDPERAKILATQLEGLNNERRRLTDLVFKAALAQIEREPALLDDAALVLAHPAWHPGVIGIVASRLVERLHRPVVLIAAPPGEIARGSARSVEGCNITAAIAAQADLLASFGGHPMAAGLLLDAEHISLFRRKLSATVRKTGQIAAEPVLQLDGKLPLAELSLELVADLNRLAPFGPGNPAPVFVDRELVLQRAVPIGRTGEHLQALVEDSRGVTQRVIWWQGAGWPLPEGRFDLAYTVRASTFRGQRDVQVEWVDARSIAKPTSEQAPPRRTLLDYRRQPDPLGLLDSLRREPGVQLWCEGDARRKLGGLDRTELAAGETLIIWSTPPGHAVLEDVLEAVQPQTVALFAVNPGMNRPDAFLERLAGLVKRIMSVADGQASVRGLAAATAQRESTVRAGLRWLASRGHIRLAIEDAGTVQLEPGDGVSQLDAQAIAVQLQRLLEETAAYRRHFETAEPADLVSW